MKYLQITVSCIHHSFNIDYKIYYHVRMDLLSNRRSLQIGNKFFCIEFYYTIYRIRTKLTPTCMNVMCILTCKSFFFKFLYLNLNLWRRLRSCALEILNNPDGPILIFLYIDLRSISLRTLLLEVELFLLILQKNESTLLKNEYSKFVYNTPIAFSSHKIVREESNLKLYYLFFL